MKTGKRNMIRVDDETKNLLRKYKWEVSSIEKENVAMGDIIKRIARGEDILDRLKRGSKERKR